MTQQEQLIIMSQSTEYFYFQFDVYISYLSNSIFKTPISDFSLNWLLGLSGKFKNLTEQYYNNDFTDQFIELFAQSNVVLVEYVYYLTNNYPQQAKNKINQLKENCKNGASLLHKISSYWREAECRGLLYTYVDLLERLSLLFFDPAQEDYENKISVVYMSSRRLSQDMSAYYSGGIISDKSNISQ